MADEMEWQPVRLSPYEYVKQAHRILDTHLLTPEKFNYRAIVRVRPVQPSDGFILMTRKYGCLANSYFEGHPDDFDTPFGMKSYLCEHQIQAD